MTSTNREFGGAKWSGKRGIFDQLTNSMRLFTNFCEHLKVAHVLFTNPLQFSFPRMFARNKLHNSFFAVAAVAVAFYCSFSECRWWNNTDCQFNQWKSLRENASDKIMKADKIVAIDMTTHEHFQPSQDT